MLYQDARPHAQQHQEEDLGDDNNINNLDNYWTCKHFIITLYHYLTRYDNDIYIYIYSLSGVNYDKVTTISYTYIQ